MILRHAAHADRVVRLGYCLNLRACTDVGTLVALLRSVIEPVRSALGGAQPFGVGMYVPASLARTLAAPAGEHELDTLARELETLGLDPFTWNAFPFGDFGDEGLKQRVFEPHWAQSERLEYTLDVARIATELVRRLNGASGLATRHVSISTHTGGWGSTLSEKLREQCAFQLALCADHLATLEESTGVRVILALEPEPGANAPTQRALTELAEFVAQRAVPFLQDERNRSSANAQQIVDRHLGACLDACHSAVEGEADEVARDLAAHRRATPAKLQYASALRVVAPGTNPNGVERLLALDEPRFLHQVRGHGAREPLAVDDLPDLARELTSERRDLWLSAAEWSCHFHVPVDLEDVGGALGTTREDADAILASLVNDPTGWSVNELHVEIETYTWEVLPGWVRGDRAVVEGIEREYRHVLGQLALAGWR